MSIVAHDLPSVGIPDLPVRRFTVGEYHRMIETGVFATDERFELMEGWITTKMSKNPAPDGTTSLLDEIIRPMLPIGLHMRIQSAITTEDSEPEPDLAIVRGAPRDFLRRHPGPSEILLVIEVAETSVDRDRMYKARIYARARIRAYWIVNLVDRAIETYGDPGGAGIQTSYGTRRFYAGAEAVAIAFGGVTVGHVTPAELFA